MTTLYFVNFLKTEVRNPIWMPISKSGSTIKPPSEHSTSQRKSLSIDHGSRVEGAEEEDLSNPISFERYSLSQPLDRL